jgi:hypothetical protein
MSSFSKTLFVPFSFHVSFETLISGSPVARAINFGLYVFLVYHFERREGFFEHRIEYSLILLSDHISTLSGKKSDDFLQKIHE